MIWKLPLWMNTVFWALLLQVWRIFVRLMGKDYSLTATSEDVDTSQSDEALFTITAEDVREEAEDYLGRELTDEELPAVLEKFKKSLEYLDWRPFLDEAIRMCQKAGQVGPDTDELKNATDYQ